MEAILAKWFLGNNSHKPILNVLYKTHRNFFLFIHFQTSLYVIPGFTRSTLNSKVKECLAWNERILARVFFNTSAGFSLPRDNERRSSGTVAVKEKKVHFTILKL